jgi:acetolactate synthase I/II/III large subunit
MNGGEALVQTLLAHGVSVCFGVPGESYLRVIEALRQEAGRIRFVVNRHESGSTYAAEAWGKLTRNPGIAFVTRGPGATNGAIGIHTAAQDSTPLVLFIGQVPSERLGAESFQEIDYTRMFGAIAKAVIEPMAPGEVAGATARALALAIAGRPGPVVVVLSEDVTQGEVGEATIPERSPRAVLAPEADAISRAAAMIDAAERPLIISGELVSQNAAHGELAALAENSGAALTAAWRRQDTVSIDNPAYVGHLGLGRAAFQRELIEQADLVIAAGCRLDDITSEDGALLAMGKALIQIHPDEAVLARSRATLAIAADAKPALDDLARSVAAPNNVRLAWRAGARAAFEEFRTVGADPRVKPHGALDMAHVVETVTSRIEGPHVIVTDAGNFSGWSQRYFPYREAWSQAAPISGAMGYAVPGALGAALALPEAEVIGFVGDGGFLMTGQELLTMANLGLRVRLLVCDNAAFGTILAHQRKAFGAGHDYGVALQNPDFVKLAEAYGAAGFNVERTEDFAAAYDAARAVDGPALIRLALDVRDISALGRMEG